MFGTNKSWSSDQEIAIYLVRNWKLSRTSKLGRNVIEDCWRRTTLHYLELEVAQPQNCRKDREDGIWSLRGNLNNFKRQSESIELGSIVHAVQVVAGGLVEVVVGGGGLDLVLGSQPGVSLGSGSELVEDVIVPLLVRLVRYTRLFKEVILREN